MDRQIEKCLLQTLVYSDIFDYPLTEEEIIRYLINFPLSSLDYSLILLKKSLDKMKLSKIIEQHSGYYCLVGRAVNISARKEREKWSEDKWTIAQKIANKLKIISTIKMVGVTGALAMKNCKDNDDLDLLIITSKNNLWPTRLLVLFVSFFLGIKRRKPNDTNINNKICFNLFLDEDHLKIESENLFMAHEISQVKPLLNRDNTYEKFLWENRWLKEYLPNAFPPSSKLQFEVKSLSFPILKTLNNVAYRLQLWYMRPKMTIEKISLHQAFFHPDNLQNKIMKKFEDRLKLL